MPSDSKNELLLPLATAGLYLLIGYFFSSIIAAGCAALGVTILLVQGRRQAALTFFVAGAALLSALVPVASYRFARFHLTHLLLILFLAALIVDRAKAKRIDLAGRPAGRPLIFFASAAVLSVLNSYLFWDQTVDTVHRHLIVQTAGIGLIVLSATAFFAAAEWTRSRRSLEAVLFFFIGAALFLALLALLAKLFDFGAFEKKLALLDLGIVYTLGLSLSGAAFLFSENSRRRWMWAASSGVFLLAILSRHLAGSRVLLAMAGSLLAVSALKSRRLYLTVCLGLLLLGVVTWFFFIENQNYEFQSLNYRLILWRDTFKVISRHPTFWLLGVGPGNYYAYSLVHTINSWDQGTWGLTTPHNQYLVILGETGLAGLGFFLWFIIHPLRQALGLFRQAADVFSRAFAAGCFGALCGLLVMGIFTDALIPSISNHGFDRILTSASSWVLLGMLSSRALKKGQ